MKLIWIFIFSLPLILMGQKHDNNWIIGGNPENGIFGGILWGTMLADFEQDPFAFRYDSVMTLDMRRMDASISDQKGKLLMYTNGQTVHNVNHKAVPGLDTISYGTYWENFNTKGILPNGGDWVSGFPIQKGAIMLPSFTPDQYALFHILRTNPPNDTVFSHQTTSLLKTEVRFDKTHPEGEVISKEDEILGGFFSGGFSACRHANGRDWWLIHNSEYNSAHYVFLYSPLGVTLVHTFTDITKINQRQTFVVGNFDREGKFYVTHEESGESEATMHLTIYTFDRSTGDIKKKAYKTHFPQLILDGTVEFSPSNQYLYTSTGDKMFQYDLTQDDILATEKIVSNYDGSIHPIFGMQTYFSSMQLGPDGRIYCIPPGSATTMHVKEYPDEDGTNATVLQNKFILPCKIFNSMPNFPNYRLGPLDGSSCDTLGLDNYPIAKYRYEPDSIDYKRIRFTDLSYFRPETWSWDFGDNSPKISQRSPFHTYAQNGTYRVCLTVSNENSSNTFCRDITIGPSAVDDDQAEHPADVTLFPNPVQDILLVTIGEYIPERGYIEIFNISGQQVHRQRAYYGHNNVDMSGMAAGTYILRFMDGNKMVKEEKIIKIEN